MPITIKDFIEGRRELADRLNNEFAALEDDIKELTKDPKVKEYLLKLGALNDARKIIKKEALEYSNEMAKKCNHPLWVLTTTTKENREEEVLKCLVCNHKKFNSTKEEKEMLYNAKRLLARISVDYLENKPTFHYRPFILNSRGFEAIREEYLKLYLKNEENQKYGYSFSVEDALFECFLGDEKDFKKTIRRR